MLASPGDYSQRLRAAMSLRTWSVARLLGMWACWLLLLLLAVIAVGTRKLGIAVPIPSRLFDAVGVPAVLLLGALVLLSPVIALTVVWIALRRRS